MEKVPAIGIDLGTTYSCVGVWQHGKVEIIANDQGNRTTASCVAFTETRRFIGDFAKNQVMLNAENTVFDAKRLIGRKYDDPNIQDDIKNWPFKVINDSGKPKIEVKFKNEKKLFVPEEISSMILTKMKETAEMYLGSKVTNAVITVPAYFNDSQRQATRNAGSIAGLNVLRLINEPTAAALAYGLDKNLKGEKNVLIFDLGGGTFDVSILTISEGSIFEVKSTAGNNHLGGEDFDNRLVNYFIDKFKRKHKKDLSGNPRALRRLKTACERAKRILSSSAATAIEIEAFHEGIDFYSRITRSLFEELNIDLFRSTLLSVKCAVADANLNKVQIDDIVLVGGSTRIPKIREMLQDFFYGKKLNLSINPDEAVAYGAAIQAAILSGDIKLQNRNVLLIDVTPLSLGIEGAYGMMTNLIKRNTIIPCVQRQTFTIHKDNCVELIIPIYEGERFMAKENNLLDTLILTEIPPGRKGIPKIDITFDINADGILNVSATENSTGRTKTITITNNKRGLSKEELDKMISDAEKYREEDQRQCQRINALLKLEDYVFNCLHAVQDCREGVLSELEKSIVKNKCQSVLKWIDLNGMSAEETEIEDNFEDCQNVCSPIMIEIHKAGLFGSRI